MSAPLRTVGDVEGLVALVRSAAAATLLDGGPEGQRIFLDYATQGVARGILASSSDRKDVPETRPTPAPKRTLPAGWRVIVSETGGDR